MDGRLSGIFIIMSIMSIIIVIIIIIIIILVARFNVINMICAYMPPTIQCGHRSDLHVTATLL